MDDQLVRYMVQKTKRWDGQEIFKILDKDTGRVSYSGYTTYETAQNVCADKNSK